MSKISELISELSHGPLDDEEAEAPENLEEDPTESDNLDEPAEPSADESDPEPAGQPDEDDGTQEEEDVDDEEPQEVVDDADADDDPEEPEEEDDLWELPTGEKISREEALQGYLRQQDYTRKRQEESQYVKSLEERRQQERQLVRELGRTEHTKEFVQTHPEALGYLLDNPEATQVLIQNPSQMEAFWKDYELMQESPTLAQRFAEGDRQELDAASQYRRVAESVTAVGTTLQQVVDAVVEEADGGEELRDEVSNYILKLGNITEGASEEQTVRGFARLYQMFFVQDQQGNLQVDPTLIRERVQLLQKQSQSKKTVDEKRQKHNESVDKALKKNGKNRRPAARGGATPKVPDEEPDIPDDFSGIVQDLMYGS